MALDNPVANSRRRRVLRNHDTASGIAGTFSGIITGYVHTLAGQLDTDRYMGDGIYLNGFYYAPAAGYLAVSLVDSDDVALTEVDYPSVIVEAPGITPAILNWDAVNKEYRRTGALYPDLRDYIISAGENSDPFSVTLDFTY